MFHSCLFYELCTALHGSRFSDFFTSIGLTKRSISYVHDLQKYWYNSEGTTRSNGFVRETHAPYASHAGPDNVTHKAYYTMKDNRNGG